MHRSRKSIVTVAAALAGVLAMAGVAAAAHGRSTPRSSLTDDTTTTVVLGGSGGTGLAGGSGGTGGTGGTGGSGVVGGTGGSGPIGGSGTVGGSGGSGAIPEPGDDHGTDAVGHDANDDHSSEASTSSMPETSTTLAPIPNGTKSFTVIGGTVTVDFENGVLSLVTATPNAGFSIDKSESRNDRIEVEFRGGDTQSRVRVRIDEGRLRVETGDH